RRRQLEPGGCPPFRQRLRRPRRLLRLVHVPGQGGRVSRRGRAGLMEQPGEFAVASAPEGIGESIWEDVPRAELLEAGSGTDSDAALEFRRTLGMFATGVTVITTRVAEQIHGMTANAFMSVSLQPPLILISVDRRAKMNALLRDEVRFGVSVLE